MQEIIRRLLTVIKGTKATSRARIVAFTRSYYFVYWTLTKERNSKALQNSIIISKKLKLETNRCIVNTNTNFQSRNKQANLMPLESQTIRVAHATPAVAYIHGGKSKKQQYMYTFHLSA